MITATITYIHHNCFLLDTEDRLLVFDYPGEHHRPPGAGDMVRRMLAGRRAVFFASHGHEDHFSTDILELAQAAWDASFVVSYDIAELVPEFDPDLFRHGRLAVVEPDESVNLDDMDIRGLESTDMGVGFAISMRVRLDELSAHEAMAGTLRIWFGGDVALWDWEGQSRELADFNRAHFDETLHQVAAFKPHVAFSNADRRLPGWTGARLFLERVGPSLFVPMHAFGKTEDLAEFRRRFALEDVPMFAYTRMGESTSMTIATT